MEVSPGAQFTIALWLCIAKHACSTVRCCWRKLGCDVMMAYHTGDSFMAHWVNRLMRCDKSMLNCGTSVLHLSLQAWVAGFKSSTRVAGTDQSVSVQERSNMVFLCRGGARCSTHPGPITTIILILISRVYFNQRVQSNLLDCIKASWELLCR